MNKDNTELQRITKALGELKINKIGKSSHFCSSKRIIKQFELVISLIKSVDAVTDVHRYFVQNYEAGSVFCFEYSLAFDLYGFALWINTMFLQYK